MKKWLEGGEGKGGEGEPLTERLERQISTCLFERNYQGDGYTRKGRLVHYCTLFDVNNQRQPIDCDFRGCQLDILVGNRKEFAHHYIPFYKCCNIESRRRKRIIRK